MAGHDAATIDLGRGHDHDALLARFRRVRSFSERLAAPLSPEDQCVQTMPDVSPTKWHLAHTTWFFETFILEPHEPGFAPFHPQFRVLFNSYYNGVGEQFHRPHRGLLSRPTVDEVLAYHRQVDRRIIEHFRNADRAHPWALLELGLHHEQQHQELLLTDIKHVLGFNPLAPVYRDDLRPAPDGPAAPLEWYRHSGGVAWIGRDEDEPGEGFCYDNEGPRHRAFVAPFEIARRPVTNAEYQAFVEDGGYDTPSLWLSDGWADLQSHGRTAPLYWTRRDGAWFEFTLGGLRPLRPQAPACHVSYFEADAFAQWAGARLPTEQEWELATCEVQRPPAEGNFVDEDALHPHEDPTPQRGPGPRQMFGDVWEWTRSAYLPYPGYAPPEGAVGEYNGKFMSGQMVLRGGSCASSADHVRATYRNFFPPGATWQFSGIRLCRDA